MNASTWAEIHQLRKMTTAALRVKYRELFAVESHSSNKRFLFRRIAWRLQVRAEGDLSERARRRASEIADDAEIRLRAQIGFLPVLPGAVSQKLTRLPLPRDCRLPPIGTILERPYHGQTILVQVREGGFEYDGRLYRSLSAIAREVTGTRWNGLAFFHLTERRNG